MDIESALWILLVWCFSTRASVATVRRMHPCASNFSWVKYLTHKINWFALTMAPRIPWSSHQTDDTKRGNITIRWKVSMRIHLITKFSIMCSHRPTDDYINGLGLYYGIWTMVSPGSDELFSLITSIYCIFFSFDQSWNGTPTNECIWNHGMWVK